MDIFPHIIPTYLKNLEHLFPSLISIMLVTKGLIQVLLKSVEMLSLTSMKAELGPKTCIIINIQKITT